jgi:glucokinase
MEIVQATLAIDVGASKIAGALVGHNCEILHEHSVPGRKALYGLADPDLTLTKNLISDLLVLAAEKNIEVVKGGACFAEYVTPSQKLNSRDQIGWNIQPKEDFAAMTKFSWSIESDVRAMALAEAHFSGLKDFLFITVSSGISHSLVMSGRPWAGATGEAIGFGITQIDSSKDSPTLEEFSSGMGIARRLQSATERNIENAQEVFALYESDENAKEVIDSAAQVLGKALAAFVDYLDPAKIVIGGGLWLGSQKYRSLVHESYLANASKRRPAPQIMSAVTGENAAVIGAALAAN